MSDNFEHRLRRWSRAVLPLTLGILCILACIQPPSVFAQNNLYRTRSHVIVTRSVSEGPNVSPRLRFGLLWNVSSSTERSIAGGQTEKPDDQPAKEKKIEEEDVAPLLTEMILPTPKQLIAGPRVDWVVMKNLRVVVAEPVKYRPNALEKMQAAIDASNRLPRAQNADALKQQIADREALHYLHLVLPDDGENPEYRLHMRYIDIVIQHEDLFLRVIDKLLDQDKRQDAYELLFVLDRRAADWPGKDQRRNRLLFLEAAAKLKTGHPEEALVFLEDLHDRKTDFPNLRNQLGVVSDRLIDEAVKLDRFHRARYFLNRLEIREPKLSIIPEWKQRMEDISAKLVSAAEPAFEENKYDVAAVLIDRAARAHPAANGLRQIHRKIRTRFQTLDVGVLQLPNEKRAYPFPTDADLRHQELTRDDLFEVGRIDDSPHYRTTLFEQWEPEDLGRLTVFELRRRRPYWESQSTVTAPAVAASLRSRLDPANAVFDERFASIVQSISVQSPIRFTVRFSRVPLRTEALFRTRVTGTNSPTTSRQKTLSRRFSLTEQSEKTALYRRVSPEPENVRYHVAEIREKKYASHGKAMQSLLRGDVSVLPHVQSWDVPALQDDNRFFVQKYALPTTHLLQPNPRSKSMQNPQLRRALASAIDRRKILSETVLRDSTTKLGRLVSAAYSTQLDAYYRQLPLRKHDLTLAISLVVSARNRMGGTIPELKLLCVPDAIAEAAVKDIIQQWGRIGIRVSLIKGDENTNADDWDLVYRTARMAEPLTDLWPFLTLDPQVRIESLGHLPDWLRQELIELDAVGDWTAAYAILHRLQRHLRDDVQIIPLWEVDDFIVIRKNIQGFNVRPVRTYQHIERWIVQPWFSTDTP